MWQKESHFSTWNLGFESEYFSRQMWQKERHFSTWNLGFESEYFLMRIWIRAYFELQLESDLDLVVEIWNNNDLSKLLFEKTWISDSDSGVFWIRIRNPDPVKKKLNVKSTQNNFFKTNISFNQLFSVFRIGIRTKKCLPDPDPGCKKT